MHGLLRRTEPGAGEGRDVEIKVCWGRKGLMHRVKCDVFWGRSRSAVRGVAVVVIHRLSDDRHGDVVDIGVSIVLRMI